MSTVDLTTRPAPARRPAAELLDTLPRRVALTLPELRLAAGLAGGAPLPFQVRGPDDDRPVAGRSLADRLGPAPDRSDEDVYAEVLAGLPDPRESLAHRGLLVDEALDAGLRGAVGLLATPSLALEISVSAGDARAVAWHRRHEEAVAALSTADGVVFELAWFPLAAWPGELARVAVPPEDLPEDLPGGPLGDLPPGRSEVPAQLSLPLGLADAASDALDSGRADLLAQLVTDAEGPVLLDGADAGGTAAVEALRALHVGTRGRLRVLVADLGGGPDAALTVGICSWVLLADGWRSLRTTASSGAAPRLTLTAVDPGDLAGDLAPLLAHLGDPLAGRPS